MIQKVQLPDNYSVQIVPDTWDNNIKVHLIDPISDVQTTLAVFENGRWRSEYVRNLDKFFEILKMHPKVRTAIKKSYGIMRDTQPYGPFLLQLQCLQRRTSIQIYKLFR
jgi:hypothetical protein